jgi:long-chain acyl-CoA synthetase
VTPAAPPLPADLEAVRTLPRLLARRVALTPDAPAYRQFDPASGAWASVSWRGFNERVSGFVAALAQLDLPRGARVAILLPNGLDAVCIDQAALALALVPVPMHAIDNPASIAYILGDSEAAVLVSQSAAQWQSLVATGAIPATLRQVVLQSPELATDNGSGSTAWRHGWRAPLPSCATGGRRRSRPRTNWPRWFTPPAPPASPRASC